MKFRMIFVIAVSILFAVQLPSCKLLNRKKIKAKAEEEACLEQIRIADSVKKANVLRLEREKAVLDSLNAVTEQLLKEQEAKYNIIVGSFVTPDYAVRLADEYTKIGYQPKIINLEGSDFDLVSAESHKSLDEAVKRLHGFQDTVEIDAWIYIAQ